MAQKYDIFISYRREGFYQANIFHSRLQAAGYRVFFDVESMRSGKFNEQLYDVIDHCKDFLLILPPNALERCDDPEDWVRKEVLRAIESKKNIIPVMMKGFEWPKPMPKGMEELANYQALAASSVEYFDLAFRRLTEQYLKSKPKHSVFLTWLGTILGAVLIICGLLMGTARLLSIPLSNRAATAMTNHMIQLDLLGGYMEANHAEWNKFIESLQKIKTEKQLSDLVADMSESVNNTRNQIRNTAPADSVPKQYSLFESLLFASRGIDVAEMEIEPVFASSYFTDFMPNLDYMDSVLANRDFGSITKKTIDSHAQLSKHLLALAYYSYMELMAKMPKNAQDRYVEVAKSFKSLPNDVPLTLSTDEYLQRQNNENTTCERIMSDLEAYVNNASEKIEELDNSISFVNGVMTSIQETHDIQDANATELALRKEKIEAKKQINEQKKAQLEELDKEYQKAYEELKANCAIEESDAKWYKWGKIVKFATFMEMVAQSREQLKIQGVHSTSSVTPDVAYAALASMLNTFKEYHPESAQLAESAKAYYKEVSTGRRRISGVIISAIKDDMTHPVHQVGDIIISMKGTPVANYDELKAAFKKEGAPEETFLRLSNGKLIEHHAEDIGPTDILGFSGLKQ